MNAESQLKRRNAAFRAVQREIKANKSADFSTLQRAAVEAGIHCALAGDECDGKERSDLWGLSVRWFAEATKHGRHLAKDRYRKLEERLDQRAKARSRFDAARASRSVEH